MRIRVHIHLYGLLLFLIAPTAFSQSSNLPQFIPTGTAAFITTQYGQCRADQLLYGGNFPDTIAPYTGLPHRTGGSVVLTACTRPTSAVSSIQFVAADYGAGLGVTASCHDGTSAGYNVIGATSLFPVNACDAIVNTGQQLICVRSPRHNSLTYDYVPTEADECVSREEEDGITTAVRYCSDRRYELNSDNACELIPEDGVVVTLPPVPDNPIDPDPTEPQAPNEDSTFPDPDLIFRPAPDATTENPDAIYRSTAPNNYGAGAYRPLIPNNSTNTPIPTPRPSPTPNPAYTGPSATDIANAVGDELEGSLPNASELGAGFTDGLSSVLEQGLGTGQAGGGVGLTNPFGSLSEYSVAPTIQGACGDIVIPLDLDTIGVNTQITVPFSAVCESLSALYYIIIALAWFHALGIVASAGRAVQNVGANHYYLVWWRIQFYSVSTCHFFSCVGFGKLRTLAWHWCSRLRGLNFTMDFFHTQIKANITGVSGEYTSVALSVVKTIGMFEYLSIVLSAYAIKFAIVFTPRLGLLR